MYKISSTKDSRCHQPSFKYYIEHKTIVRHSSETIVNIEPKYSQ